MSRKLVRHLTADWLTAANIPGLDHVYPANPGEINWAEHSTGSSSYACQAYVIAGRRPETRLAGGPSGGGGQAPNGQKEITTSIQVMFEFRATEADWLTAQDAFDDLIEAAIGQIRVTRTLGRPDVVLSAGEFSAGIVQDNGEPYALSGGLMVARCAVAFQVKEVINS